MGRKLVLIVHTSLDGFVAGPKGELDGFEAGEENLQFVCGLTNNADTMLMGRISYELLDSFWPTAKDRQGATKGKVEYSNWYNYAHKIIISTTLKKEGLMNTTVLSSNLQQEVMSLKQKTGKEILIFGSPSVARSLMREDLIDSFWIFVNPVIFGKGIPLFTDSGKRAKLELQTVTRFSNGEIALHYIKR